MKFGLGKKLSVLLAVLVIVCQMPWGPGAKVYAAYNAGTSPRIQTSPTILQDDVIVYTENVLDFGAVVNDGVDDTAAFQAAIDEASNAGGGIVYVPSGQFDFTGSIQIKPGVTLRGEWQNPDTNPTAAGTILKVSTNQGNEDTQPFITIFSQGGVKDISIWYPNQNFTSPVAYPWTITDDSANESTVGTIEMQNITLYNSYKGIMVGTARGGSTEYLIRNVYCTALKNGIVEREAWDFNWIEGLFLNSKYWINSGLSGSPSASGDQTTLKNYMRQNLTGLQTGDHIDAGSCNNIYVEDANIGIYNCAYWMHYMNINMKNVNIGVSINMKDSIKLPTNPTAKAPYGITLVGGTIDVLLGTGTCGILYSGFGPAAIQGITIQGTPDYGIWSQNFNYPLQLQKMSFANWNTYAVKIDKGTADIQESIFSLSKTQIYIGSEVTSAAILGNTFTAGQNILNSSTSSEIYINSTAVGSPSLPAAAATYTYIAERKPAQPNNFINVAAPPYNAVGDGVTDNTTAIQNALSDSASAGGGTVFIPAGKWRVNGNLSIPTGVELRGVTENVICGAGGLGTRIHSYANQNNPNGTPFITMQSNSGIKGLTIYYPASGPLNRSTTWPWTIRGNGSNIYIKNVNISNAWNGLDFNTNRCDSYQISGVSGDPRNIGIYVGGGSQNGRQENNFFVWTGDFAESAPANDVYYSGKQAFLYGNVVGDITLNASQFWPEPTVKTTWATKDTDGVVFTINDSNAQVTFLQCVTDCGYIADAVRGNLISFVDCGTTLKGFKTEPTFTGTLNVFSVNSQSPYEFANVNGGTVNFVQGATTPHDEFTDQIPQLKLNAGITNCYNMAFKPPFTKHDDQFIVASGITAVKVLGCSGFKGVTAQNSAGSKLTMSYNIRMETNIAKNLTQGGYPFATASSTYSGYNVWKAVDGNEDTTVGGGTSWCSDNTDSVGKPQYYQIDFGGSRKIYGFNLNTSSGYALKDFDIQYLDRGIWRTLQSITGNTSAYVQFSIVTPILAQCIRIQCNNGPANQPMYDRINELEVFGDPDNTTLGNILQISVTNNFHSGEKYGYIRAVDFPGTYTWQSGDYIEYDVCFGNNSGGLGGLEVTNTNNTSFRDQSDWKDENNIGGHPANDISGYAYNKWFHRKVKVPASAVGSAGKYLSLAVEPNTPSSTYTAYYDNIRITRNNSTVLELFSWGVPINFFDEVETSGVRLTTGIDYLKSKITTINSLTPPGATIPGMMQAEDFNIDGPEVAYHDTTPGNNGGRYNSQDVDIVADDGGFVVGWIAPGEYLNYDIDVTTPGRYYIDYRTSAVDWSGWFHIELDGAAITPSTQVPNTGSWNIYNTPRIYSVNLPAGHHTLKFYIEAGSFNLNWLNLQPY